MTTDHRLSCQTYSTERVLLVAAGDKRDDLRRGLHTGMPVAVTGHLGCFP